MTRDQLLTAGGEIVALIREQGEKRLENQGQFADAQDSKAAALLTAAASLAAAGTALAAAAMAFKPIAIPMVAGGTIAALGFSASAGLAAWALRSMNFHSVGWFPNDFADDLNSQASALQVEADFVMALQHRLSENGPVLRERGDLLNWSTIVLIGTPFTALIGAWLIG